MQNTLFRSLMPGYTRLSRAAVLLVLLLLPLAGCSIFGSGDDDPAIEGRYEGTLMYTFEGEDYEEFWTVLVGESKGTISGIGTLGVDQVTVSGMHEHPDITLRFTDDTDLSLGTFTGTLSGDGRVLEGVYNLSIFFIDQPVVLRRTD